ncbi:hypothetical protein TNCV_3351081 [Trichonephila clavipes]|nr:hypothetical protein TNCV_3351081 [Trichonephila clavipes]
MVDFETDCLVACPESHTEMGDRFCVPPLPQSLSNSVKKSKSFNWGPQETGMTESPEGLGSNPRDGKDVCKCIVPLWHGSTPKLRLSRKSFREAVSEWRSWFDSGPVHPSLRVRPRPKSVDFHDAKIDRSMSYDYAARNSTFHLIIIKKLGIILDLKAAYLTLESRRQQRAMGSLVVRASDSRPEGLGSMPDATKYPPSAHGVRGR